MAYHIDPVEAGGMVARRAAEGSRTELPSGTDSVRSLARLNRASHARGEDHEAEVLGRVVARATPVGQVGVQVEARGADARDADDQLLVAVVRRDARDDHGVGVRAGVLDGQAVQVGRSDANLQAVAVVLRTGGIRATPADVADRAVGPRAQVLATRDGLVEAGPFRHDHAAAPASVVVLQSRGLRVRGALRLARFELVGVAGARGGREG